MKSSFFQRNRLVACYFVLIFANIACAQKAVAPEIAQPVPAAVTPPAKRAEPVITREEWTRQNQAYRAKKKEFLTRLRIYIETDHTDPAEFERQIGSLVGGKYVVVQESGVNFSRSVRLDAAQHPIESATWRGTSPLVRFLLLLARGNGWQSHYGLAPDAECITDTEVSEAFTDPDWSYVDDSRVIVHMQYNSRTFTANKKNNFGLYPKFEISRFSCVDSLSFNFVKK